MIDFQQAIKQGIPADLPPAKDRKSDYYHAPKRNHGLTMSEKEIALQNALNYFPPSWRTILRDEFLQELDNYGHIYMYRFKPDYPIYARPINEYPAQLQQAAAMMLMIQNNLDPCVAQHPDELITYGGNGSVFQNRAQYLLTMQYLSQMTDDQQLIMYSGYPMGLFPAPKNAPKVVITNGMMIPNYSRKQDYEKAYAMGVTQYGQMTAGSWMYIGPQGIVHGTTITLLNAARINGIDSLAGRLFVTSGLGGMSGAQAKAAVIAGAVGVIAEINPQAVDKRLQQGWLDEKYDDLDDLLIRIHVAKEKEEAVSLAYVGNIVDLREKLVQENVSVDLGSDQTSLHNVYGGGYYPVGLSLQEANDMMAGDSATFKDYVKKSLQRQVQAINALADQGMYFWDYGNAFLLEAGRAGAAIFDQQRDNYKYPSYVEDIMGPMCFDYGFGPFRWVCTSGDAKDLERTDTIASQVMKKLLAEATPDTQQQFKDNVQRIEQAQANNLVVGSQARILYSDAQGRIAIAKAFNQAIRAGEITQPIVLGRDHHDVGGTDSPYRETANIKDGSMFTADMAVHNALGLAQRSATWISLHNGGGVGWGEVMNGGFGLVLDGSLEVDDIIDSMLLRDVVNGLSRRARAGNTGAQKTMGLLSKQYGICLTQ